MSILQQLSNITSNKPVVEELEPQTLSLDNAGLAIQKLITKEKNEEWLKAFQGGSAGDIKQINNCYSIICELLQREQITIEGFNCNQEASRAIFQQQYGLGELDGFRYDDSVDEIRVAPNGKVFLTRRGKLETTDIKLTSAEVYSYIEKLIPFDDVGASLDHSNPTLELVREDGTRLTAVGPPIVKSPAFALRKHGNIDATPSSLIKLQTFDEKTWNIMSLLTRGRMNQLICGDVNSGKTTLLKLLIGELYPYLSIRILDSDNELRASELYPDREIWELEAHAEVDANLSKLFATILRLTPDVIIVPEFRGIGEVDVTIEACTRGHNGSMATSHFHAHSSTQDIIRNIAMLAIKEGLNLPLEMVMAKVAGAFNIIIQTHADSKTGIKKITSINEVYTQEGEIINNTLVNWVPYHEDIWEEGEWKIVGKPSKYSCQIMNKFGVTTEEIEKVFKGE